MKIQDQLETPESSALTTNDLFAGSELKINGHYLPDEEDDDADDEDDLVLGDDDEIAGGEEEFEVELDDAAIVPEDLDDKDLVLDTDDPDEDDDEDI